MLLAWRHLLNELETKEPTMSRAIDGLALRPTVERAAL